MFRLFEIIAAVFFGMSAILWAWVRFGPSRNSSSHPPARLLVWNPAFVAVLTAFFVERMWRLGYSPSRLGGTVVGSIWLLLAAYDWFSDHRLLDWMYSQD
ncbi:MAG TPA: hypothetical protein VFC78_23045 [Tepidisphaeraceae bacterium]|nr:hypothetical protein [Tepidisphaeraceae bacterium]